MIPLAIAVGMRFLSLEKFVSLIFEVLRSVFGAGYKVISTGPGVCNNRVKAALGVENSTVCSGTASRVDVEARQSREPIPRARGVEAEAFVVVVLVRVGICAISMPFTDK